MSTRVRHGDQRLDRQSPGGQGRRTVPRLALAEGQGGYKRSGIVLLLWLALPAWGALVPAAQSLADVARAEAERRKTIVRPSRVYTNKDLKPAPRAEATAPVSESDAPPSPSSHVPADGHSLTTPDTPRPAGSEAVTDDANQRVADEEEWRRRMAAARDEVERSRTLADALQSRINALTADFSARDDPAQRATLGAQREKALAELERMKGEIAAREKAVADLEEEARRAGVPPGWVR